MVKKLIDSYEAALDLLREERYEGARRLEEIDVQVAGLKRQIAVLCGKRETVAAQYSSSRSPNWLDDVVRPLAKELAAKAGFPHGEAHGPCGLTSRAFITLWTSEPEFAAKTLVVRPLFSEENGLSFVYETGETTSECPPGSLGEAHEMNLVTAPLPDSLEEILAVMKTPRRPRFSGIAGGETKKR